MLREVKRRGLAILIIATAAALTTTALAAPPAPSKAKPISFIAPVTKTTLTVWGPGEAQGQNASFRLLDQQFMKRYPQVTIKHTGFDFNDFFGPKLRTAIAAHQGADVVGMYGGGYAQSSGYTKALRPLYDLLSPAQRKQINGFGWDTVDPGLYAVPLGSYLYVWYYNKSLFRKAGLNPAAPPATLAQLQNACTKLKTAGIQPIAAGVKDSYQAGWLHYFGFASELFSEKAKIAFSQHKLDWHDPRMTASLTMIQGLVKDGCFGNESYAKTGDEGKADFLGGKAAMLFWVGLKGADLDKALGPGNVGIFPMPRLPDSPFPLGSVNAGANYGLAITNFKPQNCSEAWAYISFMESKHAQEVEYKVDGGLPNNYAATPHPANPLDTTILKIIANPRNQKENLNVSAQENNMEGHLWAPFFRGDIAPKDIEDQMQAVRDGEPAVTVYPKPKPQPCR